MSRISIRAMAAQLGVSKSQVARDAAAGMPMDDVEAARAWRQATHDVARTADGRIDRDPPAGAPADEAEPADDGAAADPATADYRKHRAENERIKYERAQLELDQFRGSLIPVDEARRLAFTAFRQLRDAVLNVPARLQDQLAAETDAFRVGQLLELELVQALSGFSPEQVVKETEDDDDAD